MPPRFDLLNGQIRGYYVGYKAVNGTGHFVYKTVTPSAIAESPFSLTLTGLQPFTEYAVILQAFNSVGAGPRSDEVLVATLESSPSAWPSDVKCESLSSTSLRVTWQPVHTSKVNGNLLGFKVRYFGMFGPSISGDSSEASSQATEADAASTQATLSSLAKFTNYSIQVAAFTRAGEGPRSPSTVCSTGEDTPGPPAAVKAAWASSDSVTVSWLGPASPNGVVKTFTVYRKSHALNESLDTADKPVTFTVPAHVDSFTSSALAKQVHSFWVTASTKAGEGAASQVVSLTLDRDTGESSSGTRGDGILTFCLTGPARIVDFGRTRGVREGETVELACRTAGPSVRREWRKNGSVIESHKEGRSPQVLEDGSLRLSSVGSGDGGNFSCLASNDQGSDAIWYQLQVLSPDPRKGPQSGSETLPVPLLRLEEVTGKSIRVRIESSRGSVANGPAEQTSSDAISASARPLIQKIYFKNLQAKSEWKHYVVEDTVSSPSPAPSSPSLSPPGAKSGVDANGSFVLSNLLCGNQYQIYVVNLNRDGHSVSSEVLLAKTSGREPLAPPATVFLTRVNRTSFRLNLNTWSNGGCPILEGRVEYRNNRQKHWTLLSVNSLTDPILLANLSPDHLYKVRVSMKNSAGVTSVEYEIRLGDSKLVNAVFSKLPSSSSAVEGLDLLSGSAGDSVPELISLGTLHPTLSSPEAPSHATVALLVTLTVLLTLLAALAIMYKSIQGKFGGGGLSSSPTGMSGSTQADQLSFPSGTLGSHKHVQLSQPFIANNVLLTGSERGPHLHHLNYVSSPSSAELAVLRAAAASSGLDVTRSLTYNPRNNGSFAASDARVNLSAGVFGSKKMKNSSSDSAFNAIVNGSCSSNPPASDLADAQASAIYQYLTVARVARKNSNNSSSHGSNNNNGGSGNTNPSDANGLHLNNALSPSSINQPQTNAGSSSGDQQYSMVLKRGDKSINQKREAAQVTSGGQPGSPDSGPRYCTPNLLAMVGGGGCDGLAGDASSLALLMNAPGDQQADKEQVELDAATVDSSGQCGPGCPHCLYLEEEEAELLMNGSSDGEWIGKQHHQRHMNHSGHSFHATACPHPCQHPHSHQHQHQHPQQQQSVSSDSEQMFI